MLVFVIAAKWQRKCHVAFHRRQRTIGHQCLYRLSRISCLHTEQGWFPDRLLLPFVNRSILFHEIAEIQYTSVSPLIGQLSFVFIHMHITRSYRIFTSEKHSSHDFVSIIDRNNRWIHTRNTF